MKKKNIIILLIIGFSIFACLYFWIRYKELKELKEKETFQQVMNLLALDDTDFKECYIYNQLDKSSAGQSQRVFCDKNQSCIF